MDFATIRGMGDEFARYLSGFERFFSSTLYTNFVNYTHGLISDLPRKTVEPIALSAGCAVRTLQQFLKACRWDHRAVLGHVRSGLLDDFRSDTSPAKLGTIAIIDETSCRKQGHKSPGVQRQYLGCLGKVENGIVSVHLAVARNNRQALLDAELFLPQSWVDDPQRCRDAGIPENAMFRTKPQIAFEQIATAVRQGWTFDWVVFDEGYGRSLPFLHRLHTIGQIFVGEVPKNFHVGLAGGARQIPVSQLFALPEVQATPSRMVRLRHATVAPSDWEVKEVTVRVGKAGVCDHRAIIGRNRHTGEIKYWISNAPQVQKLHNVVKVAMERWRVEHEFRLAKQEAGLMHFEGQSYQSMLRHWILSLVVLAFVSRIAAGEEKKSSMKEDAGAEAADTRQWNKSAAC